MENMTSLEESLGAITPQIKEAFLVECGQAHKELGKRQREYKKVLSTRLKSRSERILEESYAKTIKRLLNDRNGIRSQIWVAGGKAHVHGDEYNLKMIKCHIECQENLARDIQKLKVDIRNLERVISNSNRKIYELNLKTVPDSQHQDFVKRTRKKMIILENRLEVGIRRECGFTASNAALREELKTLLEHRSFFNTSYTKLVQQLNSDKKYLIDLMEYACNSFEDCINVHEKLEHANNKDSKECDHIKLDMQSEMRKSAAADSSIPFLQVKNQTRPLANISKKEFNRRGEFRHKHTLKIDLYNNVLSKILEYTKTHNVDAVIETFQHQESLYYSYYSCANELSFHISLLETSVNQLYNELNKFKTESRQEFEGQIDHIIDLENLLQKKIKKNQDLNAQLQVQNRSLENLFQGIVTIFNICQANAAPLMWLLGDHTHVNVRNMRRFLKILEHRVLNILAAVYVTERNNDSKLPRNYVVKEIHKLIDYPTDLDDVVLAQQCPECAEGEAYNIEDGGEGINVFSMDEAKHKLFEKVNQPEMQYRLHSISQCRLPRSRLLASKRH